MSYIKVFYEIEDDIDYNCLSPCIDETNKSTMCGSHNCISKCKYCFGAGEMVKLDLKTKSLDFNVGWIYCAKTYNKYTWQMKIRRFFHKLKY